ncbi:1-acyl-sn-glycerol-3-phosphate acyltransferase [bacterium]|nr:1-acyl-sn-glycerol-3-phosphate acyltransferase [bacterium]
MEPKVEPQDIIRGVLPLIFITLNLSIWILPLVILALLKLMIPLPALRRGLYRLMIGIYILAVRVDDFLFHTVLKIRFDVDPLEDLSADKNYLLISNHQSWADVLVYQSILINRTPIIKFIVKQELLYLPLIGLICWAYEYPRVHRKSFQSKPDPGNSRKDDLKTLRRKLADVGQKGSAIINFAEGTRFTDQKRIKYDSPYEHLLKPRSGGFYFILNTFGHQIDSVLDFTIAYDCSKPVFFKFLGKRCPRVMVRVTQIPMADLLHEVAGEDDQLDFNKVDAWLKARWIEKDRIIGTLLRDR